MPLRYDYEKSGPLAKYEVSNIGYLRSFIQEFYRQYCVIESSDVSGENRDAKFSALHAPLLNQYDEEVAPRLIELNNGEVDYYAWTIGEGCQQVGFSVYRQGTNFHCKVVQLKPDEYGHFSMPYWLNIRAR